MDSAASDWLNTDLVEQRRDDHNQCPTHPGLTQGMGEIEHSYSIWQMPVLILSNRDAFITENMYMSKWTTESLHALQSDILQKRSAFVFLFNNIWTSEEYTICTMGNVMLINYTVTKVLKHLSGWHIFCGSIHVWFHMFCILFFLLPYDLSMYQRTKMTLMLKTSIVTTTFIIFILNDVQ